MVSHWGVSDSKSSKITRTIPNILADLNNAIVWIVSTCLLISKSSTPCTNSLVTVPSARITIGITITFMFHSFSVLYQRLGTFCFLSILTYGQPADSLFFLLTATKSDCLAKICWSGCISTSQRILCVSFCRMDSGLGIYHLIIWLNSNFLQWITFLSQLGLVLDSLD